MGYIFQSPALLLTTFFLLLHVYSVLDSHVRSRIDSLAVYVPPTPPLFPMPTLICPRTPPGGIGNYNTEAQADNSVYT